MNKRIRFLAIILALLVCNAARAQFSEYKLPEKYLQYVPIAADLVFPFVGVKAENPFVDRIIAAGIGYVSEAIIVNALKYTIREPRPDGSANNSFPSGHTATAFLGAELVRREYGWGWGAGAYAVATSVAVFRVVHGRHYWWDTLAGAGIGVLSANIGYWLLGTTRNIFGIETPEGTNLTIAPSIDPYSGAMCAQLAFRF